MHCATFDAAFLRVKVSRLVKMLIFPRPWDGRTTKKVPCAITVSTSSAILGVKI